MSLNRVVIRSIFFLFFNELLILLANKIKPLFVITQAIKLLALFVIEFGLVVIFTKGKKRQSFNLQTKQAGHV